MGKREVRLRRKLPRKAPYYVAYRLQSVEDLEAKLNELREEGFTIKDIMCGLETYTVVALMPDL